MCCVAEQNIKDRTRVIKSHVFNWPLLLSKLNTGKKQFTCLSFLTLLHTLHDTNEAQSHIMSVYANSFCLKNSIHFSSVLNFATYFPSPRLTHTCM